MFDIIKLGTTIPLKKEFKADGIVVFQSAKLDLNPSASDHNAFDNTALNCFNGDEILLHMGFRRCQNAIVFNSFLNNAWGPEERIPLKDAFKGPDCTVMIYDHGDRFQILFNYHTVKYYNKRSAKNVTALRYDMQPNQISLFSDPVAVNTYSSMAKMVAVDD
jgi:hypothetical protein